MILKESVPEYKAAVKRIIDYAPSSFPKQKIFIVGCENSMLLARFALQGWEISGICNSEKWLNALKELCEKENCSYGDLILGDYKTYDCSQLANRYTILVSTGLLLKVPYQYLKKWLVTLKPGGTVFTGIPNCESINGWIYSRISPESWADLNRINSESLDKIHHDFGLVPIRNSYYSRGVDFDMLVPWDDIRKKMRPRFLFKFAKYIATIVQKAVNPFVKDGDRLWNSFIYAIYKKPDLTILSHE